MYYSKTCVKLPFSKRPKIGFQEQLSLNAGRKYCRMLIYYSLSLSIYHPLILSIYHPLSILQYFRPLLIYHLSLRSLFCLFLSGRLRQVLLYITFFSLVTCDSSRTRQLAEIPKIQLWRHGLSNSILKYYNNLPMDLESNRLITLIYLSWVAC